MNKAFIFDMDGVIVDSERTWNGYEEGFLRKVFGKEIYEKYAGHDVIGLSILGIYDIAVSFGFTMPKEEFYREYDKQAKVVYQQAPIAKGLNELLEYLQVNDYTIGLVSASPISWINQVLDRAKITYAFDYILSLHEREDLEHKPEPHGFLEAMKELHASPQTTIILEDSNMGIQAAKASGAFTIGFKQHLLEDYQQTGADVYADSMKDVMLIVEKQLQKR